MRVILVTGALGQIGSELVPALRDRYGADRVVASDLCIIPAQSETKGPYEHLDCTQSHQILEVIRRHDVGTIYHLAALLSATAEERPLAAWSINLGGLYNVLEAARQHRCQVFFPAQSARLAPQRHAIKRHRSRSSGRPPCTASQRCPVSCYVTITLPVFGVKLEGPAVARPDLLHRTSRRRHNRLRG